MEHVPVTSSNLESIGYDPATLLLEIQFLGTPDKPGGLYQYAGVLPEDHAALMTSESVGKHFHAHVKDQYKTAKLPPPGG